MEASTSYGTPALRVRGKLVTRLRAEDDSLVLHSVASDECDMLMGMDPEVFHITPHYAGYPVVLARLATLHPERLWPFLVRRWREIAPKRVVAGCEAAQVEGGKSGNLAGFPPLQSHGMVPGTPPDARRDPE